MLWWRVGMRRESLLPFAAARSDSELQEALYSEARQQRSDAALQLVLIAAFVAALGIAVLLANDTVPKLLAGGGSLAGCAHVVWCYYGRSWRRHPNRILVWRATANAAVAVAVLLFDVEVMMRAEGAPCDRAAQIINPLLVNFGLQASELWTLVLTIDVWLMMKAPLSSSSPSRWRSYHALVWGGAAAYLIVAWAGMPLHGWAEEDEARQALVSACLLPPPPPPPAPPPSPGCSAIVVGGSAGCEWDGTSPAVEEAMAKVGQAAPLLRLFNTLPLECWPLDAPADESAKERSKLGPVAPVAAYLWVPLLNGCSLWVLYLVGRNFSAGTPKALAVRRRVISRSANAIIFNLLYWLPLYCNAFVLPESLDCSSLCAECRARDTWHMSAMWERGCGGDRFGANAVAVLQLFLSAQGVFTTLLWGSVNEAGIFARGGGGGGGGGVPDRHEADDGAPQDNRALAGELMHYVREAVREATAHDADAEPELPAPSQLSIRLVSGLPARPTAASAAAHTTSPTATTAAGAELTPRQHEHRRRVVGGGRRRAATPRLRRPILLIDSHLGGVDAAL